MKKYDFQDEAVDWLFEKTLDPASKKTIVLNAPTGSGKTVILIKYIDRLLAVKRNLAVVWLCPGKGDLEEQSRGSFDYFLPSRQAYYLKVLNQETKKQICDIAISPFIYNYMKEQLDMLPDNKMKAKDFYICFSGVLEKSRYSFKCKLRDSRLLVLEKID